MLLYQTKVQIFLTSKPLQNANTALINTSYTAKESILLQLPIFTLRYEWKCENLVSKQWDIRTPCSCFTPFLGISHLLSCWSAVCKCIYAGWMKYYSLTQQDIARLGDNITIAWSLEVTVWLCTRDPPVPPNVSVILFNGTPGYASWKELKCLPETTISTVQNRKKKKLSNLF